MKKRKTRLKHRLVQTLDLPMEAAENMLRVVLLSNTDMTVENHAGVFECGDKRIRLLLPDGMLCVEGKSLILKELSEDKAYICGTIQAVNFA